MRREREDAADNVPASSVPTHRAPARSGGDAHAHPHSTTGETLSAVYVERDTARGDLSFFPNEADTLTAHEGLPTLSRRDTMPVPPLEAAPSAPPSSEALDDDDILEDEPLDDDTQTHAHAHVTGSDEPTSPTLSLANRSNSAREVYRLFLASDYAPALELANELIAQGDDDPMLITIARECRSTIASVVPSSFSFDPKMTLEEVATMTGMPVEQVLGLLERFVAMGVFPGRQPQ